MLSFEIIAKENGKCKQPDLIAFKMITRGYLVAYQLRNIELKIFACPSFPIHVQNVVHEKTLNTKIKYLILYRYHIIGVIGKYVFANDCSIKDS